MRSVCSIGSIPASASQELSPNVRVQQTLSEGSVNAQQTLIKFDALARRPDLEIRLLMNFLVVVRHLNCSESELQMHLRLPASLVRCCRKDVVGKMLFTESV